MEHYNPYFQVIDGRPVVTDYQRLRNDWEEFNRNIKFLTLNYESLLNAYPDQWVAVYRESVIAKADSQKDLLANLDELQVRKKSEVTEFLSTNPMPLIL